ncbi:MAG: wax ester/triacylglycerol synthase family O-acyltransferase [Candidatus Nanopelagicales bacterium]
MVAIERLSSGDLTTLATDHGQVPMNIGAVLTVGPGPGDVVETLRRRIAGIRRFRQRLLRPGFGAGRPLWVDDPAFDVAAHVRRLDTDDVLEAAARLVCTPLPMGRPLWTVRWVDGLPDGRIAVVLVVHHVLADGMGGLAVLASLTDGMPEAAAAAPTAPWPTRRELAGDAVRGHVAALATLRASGRQALAGMREMGLFGQRPSLAERSSLLQPTSDRRTVRVVRVQLRELLAVAHARGATLNDVVLTAVTGALFDLLASRGEHVDELVVSVPVSGRQSGADLGNQVGAAPVAVVVQPDPQLRLRAITASTQRLKQQERGHSAVLLGWLFRGLAAVRLGQFFVDHQRLVHTFETNLRGPQEPVHIAGRTVEDIVPIAVNPGNVTVSFDVLSYAGGVVITVVADPAAVPDLDRLAGFLDEQLAGLLG